MYKFKVGDKALVVDVESDPAHVTITTLMKELLGCIVIITAVYHDRVGAIRAGDKNSWQWNFCNLSVGIEVL